MTLKQKLSGRKPRGKGKPKLNVADTLQQHRMLQIAKWCGENATMKSFCNSKITEFKSELKGKSERVTRSAFWATVARSSVFNAMRPQNRAIIEMLNREATLDELNACLKAHVAESREMERKASLVFTVK